MTSSIQQQAGVGRAWRQQTALISCDGGKILTDLVCRLTLPVTGTTAREARQFARTQGWVVNQPSPRGRNRLDYCPEHVTAVEEEPS
jgi:hypothetical protein